MASSKPLHHSQCKPSHRLFSYPMCPRRVSLAPPQKPNLRWLTSRVVQLTHRRLLHQIMEEIEMARERYGKLNTIVMNAVVEACVHCGDMSLCSRCSMKCLGAAVLIIVTYGTILKGLEKARRIDEAFQVLESVERGTAVGSPKLSAHLVFGLLNALVEAGDLRRANGLLTHYGFLLREGGSATLRVYNLLKKGYINAGLPYGAITMRNEMLCLGLKLDRLTYNILIYACVKAGKLEAALQFVEEMKVPSYMKG